MDQLDKDKKLMGSLDESLEYPQKSSTQTMYCSISNYVKVSRFGWYEAAVLT